MTCETFFLKLYVWNLGHREFTAKPYLWISRPLWATYVGTPEQNPSSILISELIKVRNWVVENFDGISHGLLCTVSVCILFIPI